MKSNMLYCETLLGQTPFEELPFNIAQPGFKQALIAFNVLLMGAQTGNSLFIHNALLAKMSLKKSTLLNAVTEAYCQF